MKNRPWLIFLVLLCLSTPSAFASEIDTLRDRLRADFVATTDISEVANFLSTQNPDGSWPDVNYANTDESRWLPILHLRRVRAIAAAYYTSGHAFWKSAPALDAVDRGLIYWYGRNSTSINWWHLEVNTPQQLGSILVACQLDLPPTTVTSGAAELFAGRNTLSAQNRIYTSFSGVYQAILRNDATYLANQFSRIRGQATYKRALSRTNVTNNDLAEGIRTDFSFYQHGPALYNGFYGAHFVTDMGFWMAMSEGLSFGFTPAEKVVVQDYVLEGHRWTNRGGVLDPNITNRKISHDNYDYVTLRYHDPIVYGLEYLRTMSLPRAAEIESFYQHMTGNGPSQIAGNRSFWKTDFMVQAGAGYQISTKLWSYHNEGTETLNGDNLQGQFLPLGGTFLLLDGNEYLNIFPVWDWGRIPGTTTLRRDPGAPSPGTLGTRKFAGGISNGTEGAMAYDHNYDAVAARKSWFYFADATVMLGAGITGGNGSLSVNSTLNQSWLRGEVTIGSTDGESTLPSGESAPAGLQWVFHDRVGYLFPEGGPITVARKTQTGSWREINDDLPSTLRSGDVFSLWFNHGLAPANQTYAAILVPGRTKSEFDTFRGDNPIAILANTSALQAVRHSARNLVQAVFFQAGSLTTPQGLTITVSQPCLILADQATSPATITVADPTQELTSLTVTVAEAGLPDRELTYVLPTGDDAGRSTAVNSIPVVEDPVLSGSVSAYSHQTTSGLASYASDGITNDDTKRWASDQSYPEWIEIDLGADYALTSIELFTYANRAYRFTIEVKPDGGTYTLAVDRTNNSQTGPIRDEFGPVTGRFVRVTLTGAFGYTGGWSSLNEVRIRGRSLTTPYAAWSAGIDWGATPENQRGPEDDPDHDGHNNQLERALGGSPLVADASLNLFSDIQMLQEGGMKFIFSYNKAADDLIYELIHSSDLATWSADDVGPEDYDEEIELYTRSWIAPTNTTRAFVRLRVSPAL